MITLDKPLTQSAAMKVARDIQLANYERDTYRTAAGFLWQALKACYDEYLEYESISEAAMEQALVALEWSAEDANETETT